MKNTFVIILLFISIFSFGQKINFNIRYSEPLAVFVFIQNISDNYRENSFKKEFKSSKYNTKENQKLIAKFNTLNIDYSYEFSEFPYSSKIPLQTRDLLKKNLIESSNLNDFVLRSVGIIPNETLINLTELISTFTPIYNELIYNPNKEVFEKQLKEITQFAEQNQTEKYFETGLRFYNSMWNTSIPFEIAFYPLPNSQSFTAQAFYNNFISAIPVNLIDYVDLFSVMLHETFHIIYNEQSLETKSEIASWFKENTSKNSNYAYLILNEVLATSLGNGYVFENLTGQIDTNDWYYQVYVGSMARKVYPLIKEYIIQDKSIDKNFVEKYIKIYDDNFPNWINELENIMSYRYVISENNEDLNIIQQLFWYRSIEENVCEITEKSLSKLLQKPLTKIIIVSKDNTKKLELIKNTFPELNNWKFNSANDFTYKILLKDKSQLIIINQKQKELDKLIMMIK